MRRLFRLVCVLCLVAGCGMIWDGWHFLQTPAATPGRDVVITIEPGSTLAEVAALLEREGVVSDAFRFQLLARVRGMGGRLQAGRFLVKSGWLPQKILDWLVSGQAVLRRVTVREGLPWWDVGRVLEQAGLCRAEDFNTVIHDAGFLRHWGIPFDSAEGFLYPETYFMPQPRVMDLEAARAAAGRMVDTFWRKAGELWPEGRPDTATLRRVLTLASIVERETAVPAERPRVAGVYVNRLKKHMLLQADPTVIYGLGPDFKGPLLTRHLQDDGNAYNTYRAAGLPPGPICSPGLPSLRAALSPELHEYLYFVANGRDGGHVFSATLSEHNRAVREYRQVMRDRN
ncbi:MAG: endolytic transglycosylase MltG [Desulfovibrionaceae bacterium]|nr:endolytic transglycosylase MltG [Desulfovibrionaceae bacterium]